MASKRINAKRLEFLPNADSGVDKSVIRVCNRHIDASKRDRAKFFRNELVSVINKENRRKIVAIIKGNGRNDPRLNEDQVALDYDSRDLLGLHGTDRSIDLIIKPANWWELYAWFWNHPDPGYQISTRLAIIALGLGVLSFVQSVSTLMF